MLSIFTVLLLSSCIVHLKSQTCIPTDVCFVSVDGGNNDNSLFDSSYKYVCTGQNDGDPSMTFYEATDSCSGSAEDPEDIEAPYSLFVDAVSCSECSDYMVLKQYGASTDQYDLTQGCANKDTDPFSYHVYPIGCYDEFFGSSLYSCSTTGGPTGNGYYERIKYQSPSCSGSTEAPSYEYFGMDECICVNDTTHLPTWQADYFYYEMINCGDGPSGIYYIINI